MTNAGKRPIMESVISLVLRWGVTVSAAVIILGMVLLVLKESSYGAGWSLNSLLTYNPQAPPPLFPPLDLGRILAGTVALEPFAVIETGLLLLILTPVLRVAVSAALFAAERDRIYLAITLGVLAILLVSLLVVR